MIRLEHDHEARKTKPFLLRQQLQSLLPNPSLVADAMQVPSGIAILAPTPAKAAEILQYKDDIERRFGKAVVERQESWTTFIVGPLPKQVTTMDEKEDPLDGLILQEPGLASIRDEIPIKRIAWKNRSKESSDLLGQVRIHIPKTKAHKFPKKLQLFGFAVGIQRIQDRKPIPTCEKCHGFHSTRTCARQPMCKMCGTESHEGSCAHPIRCLNCRGPHESTSISCPARSCRKNGAIVRPSGAQLRHIRIVGRREFIKAHPHENTQESTPTETCANDSNFTTC
ncbi:putative effector protein [Erysiphe necator]|uniref:Putative effector protein n=1 Tax=Uncinula necator TaxID=52586 RepID=A0A0B1P8P1_UNCNE|nr:putative effector protein [Erysiphe necator]